MVKLIFCLRRRPDMSAEEFHRYWREEHAPLVTSHASALRIRRYVQVHTVSGPVNAMLAASRGAPEGFDGVAELWFDDTEALVGGAGSDAGRAAAAELALDEARFIDHSRSPLFVAEEHPVISG
ncbi:MAG TPA: EthD domain-containing protein [Acidimicrobiales bacterium]|nr:EthD domain-containing protein [Acidimicrobiales bacterium]